MAAGFGNLLPPVVAVLQANITDFSSKMAAARGEMEVVAKTGGGHIDRIAAFGKKALAATAIASVAVLGVSAKAAIDFEDSFAGIRKTVDATEADFKKLEGGMRDLAKQIPINVNELNQIGEAAGALGIQREHILGFTKTMAELGVTTNLTSLQAADSFARIANIMGVAQDQFDEMGSVVVALGNAGASTESEIVAMSLRIAGAGKVIGLSVGEVLGLSSALSSVGLEAEAGGSAMSRLMVNIASAVGKGGAELDRFARVAGVSASEFARMWKDDAALAIITFVEGLGRMQDEGKDLFAVLESLGITEVRLRDATLRSAGAGKLMREQLELQSKAWGENNALQKEAEKRFETTKSQIILLGNKLQDVGITIGQAVLPPLIALFGWLAENKALVIALAAVIGGALAVAIGTYLVGQVTAAIGTLAGLAGAVKNAAIGIQIWAAGMGGAATQAVTLTGAVGILSGALGVLAAAGAGWAIGTAIHRNIVDPIQDSMDAADKLRDHFQILVGGLDHFVSKGGRVGRVASEVAEQMKIWGREGKFTAAAAERVEQGWTLVLKAINSGDSTAALAVLNNLRLGTEGWATQSEIATQRAKEYGTAISITAEQWRDHQAAGTEATGALSEGLQEVIADIEEYEKVLQLAIDPMLRADDAAIGLADQIARVGEQFRKNGTAIGLATDKERENFRAVNDLIRAAGSYVTAQAEAGRITNDVATRNAELIRKYQELQQQFPALAGHIQGYIDQLNGIPTQVNTQINVNATLTGNKAAIKAITEGAGTGLVFTPQPRAEGGFIEHPEIALIGERGRELVLPLYDQARTQQLLMQAGLAKQFEGTRNTASISIEAPPVPVIPGGTSSATTVTLNVGDIHVTESRDGRGSARGVRDELIRASKRIGKLWPVE